MKSILFLLFISVCFNLSGQDLNYLVDSFRRQSDIPEIAFAVITKDKILEMNFLGTTKVDGKTQASFNDRFHLGSNTKAMTGFIAATLVQQKKIQWDTKFFDLYPTWTKFSDSAYLNMTLADLLSHRAGIAPFTDGAEFEQVPALLGDVQSKREAFSQYALKLKPVISRGLPIYTYSNAGYTLAALMIGKSCSKSWEQLVKKVFNTDLKIEAMIGWPSDLDSNQTYGHWEEDGKTVEASYDFNAYPIGPAGNINLSLRDYIKFIQLNLLGLSGSSNYLNADIYQYLHNGIEDYSIGWANNYDKHEPINFSTHSGSAGTYYCATLIDQSHGIAYIIMANSGSSRSKDSVGKILELLRKQYGS